MQDRGVLVTGAARRIGAAIARRLHGAGARVALHCHRSRDEADALAGELNGARRGSRRRGAGRPARRAATLARIVEDAASAFGPPRCAREQRVVLPRHALRHHRQRDWEDLIGTNLRAPLLLAQAAAPRLRESKGAIVNIVDIHAERPLKDFVVYSIAKAGLVGLTRSLALELGPDVRVNGVAPGAILWPDGGEHFDPAEKSRITEQTPLARIGSPEDVAGAVKYLLFDAPFVTGQVLAVDGGRNIHL